MVGSLGSSCRYQRFLSCLGCSSWPNKKKKISPYTTSFHSSSSPSKLGRQSCRDACLFMGVSGLHKGKSDRQMRKIINGNITSSCYSSCFISINNTSLRGGRGGGTLLLSPLPLTVSSEIFAYKELYLRPNKTSQILFGINSLNDILESVVGFMHVT